MKTYSFELSFKLPEVNADGEHYLDALYEAGCDDASIGIGRKGYIGCDFSREATTIEEAVESAIRNVREAIPGAQLVNVGPDWVGVSDIAAILECSRQNIRQLLETTDGTAPIPAYIGKRDMWHFAEVLTWLRDEKGRPIEPEMIEVATHAMQFNSEQQLQKAQAVAAVV
jgi:hypothetical protein